MLLAYRGADDCGDDVAAAAGDDGCCGRVVRSRRTARSRAGDSGEPMTSREAAREARGFALKMSRRSSSNVKSTTRQQQRGQNSLAQHHEEPERFLKERKKQFHNRKNSKSIRKTREAGVFKG